MKILLLVFSLFLSTLAFSQGKYLKLTDNKSGYEKVYKENKKISIKTMDGEKIKGRLQIVDEEHIQVGNMNVPLVNIYKIQKHGVGGKVVLVCLAAVAGFATFVSVALFTAHGAAVIFGILTVGFSTLALSRLNFLQSLKMSENTNLEVFGLME